MSGEAGKVTLQEVLKEAHIADVYGFEAARRNILNCEHVVAAMLFAAEVGKKRIHALLGAFFFPDMSRRELAARLNISEATLKRYICDIELTNDLQLYIARILKVEGVEHWKEKTTSEAVGNGEA